MCFIINTMKNIIKKILLLSFILFLLTSCEYNFSFKPFNFPINEIKEVKIEKEEGNYYSFNSYSPLTYIDSKGNTNKINSYKDLYSNDFNSHRFCLPSTGEVNLLVIPISFTNSNKTNQNKKKIMIENAFFGLSETTIFESVSSYYYKSSYGSIKIKGEVTDFINLDYSYLDIENKLGSYTSASRKIVEMAIKTISQEKGNDFLKKFDLDNNSYIDSIYLIYDAPISEKNNSLFWAYVDTVSNISLSNDTKIYPNIYGWTSFEFISKNMQSVDTHTLIHETGHLFGLLDYYNEYTSCLYQPLGYMDMMDYNIGDHTAFSKMLLNWVTPKVVKDEGVIELRPFSSSGELILIPSGTYNNTQYDEYLLLEYFAPEGINKKDLNFKFSYTNNEGEEKTFSFLSSYGIKLYHVDASLIYYSSKNQYGSICDYLDKDSKSKLEEARKNNIPYYLKFKNSNNVLSNNEPVLYRILEKSGSNSLVNGEPLNNKQLFIKGDSFGVKTYKDFTFNNGNKINFTFIIEQFSTSRALIRFKFA